MDLEQIANRHGWTDEEARIRNGICEIGKLCYSRNLIAGADGNISAKLHDDTIIITPPGAMTKPERSTTPTSRSTPPRTTSP